MQATMPCFPAKEKHQDCCLFHILTPDTVFFSIFFFQGECIWPSSTVGCIKKSCLTTLLPFPIAIYCTMEHNSCTGQPRDTQVWPVPASQPIQPSYLYCDFHGSHLTPPHCYN